jgi:membrane associated rhomboid family serine protease
MGIHDRDYYRDGSRGMFQSFGQQGATIWLIAITCAVFIAQMVGRDLAGVRDIEDAPVTAEGIYNPQLIAQGEVWRLFTPIFLHAGLLHIACNMLVLYWTGTRLEERYGSKEFLAFYLLAGVAANAGYFLIQEAGLMPMVKPVLIRDNGIEKVIDKVIPALGASGAVTAALVLYAFHHPRQRVYLYFVIPMPVWVLVVLFVALNTLGALGAVKGQVAYAVHLCGAFFGLVYFQSGRRITALLPSLPSRSARRVQPRLRVLPPDSAPEHEAEPEPVGAAVQNPPPRPADPPPDEHLEARVDRILEKVSKHGQESLTAEERELLFRASELYKKRRK